MRHEYGFGQTITQQNLTLQLSLADIKGEGYFRFFVGGAIGLITFFTLLLQIYKF